MATRKLSIHCDGATLIDDRRILLELVAGDLLATKAGMHDASAKGQEKLELVYSIRYKRLARMQEELEKMGTWQGDLFADLPYAEAGR